MLKEAYCRKLNSKFNIKGGLKWVINVYHTVCPKCHFFRKDNALCEIEGGSSVIAIQMEAAKHLLILWKKVGY